MATYYTADPHYGHGSVIRTCARPFSSVEEMDEEMVSRHNEVVRRSDDVYIVGDFSLGGREHAERVFRRLNGRKHLILGNHDRREVEQLPWSSKPLPRREVRDEGRIIILDHYAMRTWNKILYGAYHFFGHSHGKLPGFGRSTDVGVDAWDFRPVTADQVIARMLEQNADFDAYVKDGAGSGRAREDDAPVFGFGR